MKTYFVDSFTTQKFKGNPAAVCLLEKDLEPPIMQAIATEIGFSETAFVRKTSDGNYTIRFFTPKQEIPLCGHATLASAKILFDTSNLENITFVNGENVELQITKAGNQIVMQFPLHDTAPLAVPQALLNALKIDQTLNTRYNPNHKIILLEIHDSDQLAQLQPNFVNLIQSYQGINGVLVTAQSKDPDFDFQYRYFWPWSGTNEDPVTGAVQTFLTKYWAEKLGKNTLRALQCSQRTGTMTTELRSDKVLIYGEAVTVFEGEFKH